MGCKDETTFEHSEKHKTTTDETLTTHPRYELHLQRWWEMRR